MKITVTYATYTIEESLVKEFLENPDVIAYYEKLTGKDFSLDNFDKDIMLDIAYEYFDDIVGYERRQEWNFIE